LKIIYLPPVSILVGEFLIFKIFAIFPTSPFELDAADDFIGF